MSITQEEAVKIVRFMKTKDSESAKIDTHVLEGSIYIYTEFEYEDKTGLILADSGNDEYSYGLEITSASIENNKLHLVLETEEELLIPIRDD